MLKKMGLLLALICVLLGVLAYMLFTSTVDKDKGQIYYVRAGMSRQVFVTELAEQGVIKQPWFYSILIHLSKRNSLKTGEYFFRQGSTPFSIWRQVTTGKGLYYRAFTIVPGWSFAQLRKELLLTDTLRHNTAQLSNKQVMQLMAASQTEPEGLFYPETYYYTRDVPDLVILKRAYDLMQSRLNEAWESRSIGLPYKNAYEALIAASLIEKEAYLNSERKTIAGVLINRLRSNMLLQIDPTVIYGMGDKYQGKIHKSDLLTDTAYNTYVHKGLPPTPIALPGQASIDAATHPETHNYFYFVARGDGSHQFSQTLIEHNVAVDKANKNKPVYFNQSRVQKHIYTRMLTDMRGVTG